MDDLLIDRLAQTSRLSNKTQDYLPTSWSVQMHPRYWLTWKRGKQLYPRWVVATFPLIITLVASAIITVPLPWQDSNSTELLAIGGVAIVVIYVVLYRFTRSASEVLYYPPLHKRLWIGVSTVVLLLVGLIVTYLAYICFLVPLNNPVIPDRDNIVLGTVLASSYALFLGGWKTKTLGGDRCPVANSEVAIKIRESLQNLQGNNPHFEDSEELINGLEALAEQFESEPLMDQSERPEIILTWCDECSKSNSLISRLRMIPRTGKKPTSDRTEEQIARFQELENDLHTMGMIDLPSER